MRSAAYEQALAKAGLEFEYVEALPLAQIDAARSLRNQARLDEPLDEELVAQYARMDREGYEAPPLVAWRPGKGRLVLIDGNQRLAAKARNGRKAADAYVVKTADQQVADRLTWTFNNAVNGKRLTRDEALAHAVSFVRKYGASQREAAAEWGVPQATLNDRVQVEKARDVLAQNNIRTPPSMSEQAVKVLYRLSEQGEDLFVRAAGLAASHGLSYEDCEELTRDVQRAKTSEEKRAKIDEYAASERARERKALTKGGKLRRGAADPRLKFSRLLKELRNLLEDYGAEGVKPAPSDWKPAREVAAQVCEMLTLAFGLGAVPTARKEVS